MRTSGLVEETSDAMPDLVDAEEAKAMAAGREGLHTLLSEGIRELKVLRILRAPSVLVDKNALVFLIWKPFHWLGNLCLRN